MFDFFFGLKALKQETCLVNHLCNIYLYEANLYIYCPLILFLFWDSLFFACNDYVLLKHGESSLMYLLLL